MDQNLYKTNLNYLESNQRISASDESAYLLLKNPDRAWENNFSAIKLNGYEKDGIRFHSARDPQREAQRQIQHILEGNKKHIVFLGTGLGYPLAEALKNPDVESILLIETEAEVLFYCLSIQELSQTRKDIYLCYCPEPQMDSLENILPFFQNKNLDKITVYHHRPSFQVEGSKFPVLEAQLSAIMYKRAINQATIIKFQGLWNKNIALNVKEILKGQNLNQLIDKFKGKVKHIVLCGAGPSLSESYTDLIKYRDRYFLITVDTAFIPLVKNNIIPDIVISADPQWLNHFFALSPMAAKSIWLMDPVVCYQSAHYLNKLNASIYWWDNPFYMDMLLRDFQSRGEIAHGGSVSTNGFDLALKLKPESITLVGQDLSFSSKTAHVKGAVLESMVFYKNNRFHGFEMHNLKQMKSLPPRKVKQCIDKNDRLFTNDKMQVFIDWFENQMVIYKASSKIKFYNATAHGVFLEGFTHKPLCEILENSSSENFSGSTVSHDKNENGVAKIRDQFINIQKGSLKLESLYRRNMELTKKSRSLPSERLRDINHELNKNDDLIKKYPEVNKILAINAQSSILKITESGDSSYNSGLLLYKSMHLSARRLNYFIEKVLKIISENN